MGGWMYDAGLPHTSIFGYVNTLGLAGFDNRQALMTLTYDDLVEFEFRLGHARILEKYLKTCFSEQAVGAAVLQAAFRRSSISNSGRQRSQRAKVISHSTEKHAVNKLQGHIRKFIVKKQVITAMGGELDAAGFQKMLSQKRILAEENKKRIENVTGAAFHKASLSDVLHTSGETASQKSETAFKLLERQRGSEVVLPPEELLLYMKNWYISMASSLDHFSFLFWVVAFSTYLVLEYEYVYRVLGLFFRIEQD